MEKLNIRQVLYASQATIVTSDATLLEILEVAKRNNAKSAVTGLLIAREGRFLQLLEGQHEDVQKTIDRIKLDSRHEALRIMIDTNASARAFPRWSMGYVDPRMNREKMDKIWPAVEQVLAKNGTADLKILKALKTFNAS